MEDRLLLTTFQVVNTNDDNSTGSLRWAIGQTNSGTGGDFIKFNVSPGAGVQVIHLNSALPAITVPVTIDGTTEPNYNGSPLIELDGTNAGAGVDGLTVSAGATTVVGLAIVNFKGNGIKLSGSGGDVIQADYLGIGADGTTLAPNGADGLFVGTSSNTIGGTQPGQGNLIGGNTKYGIELNGGDSNLVAGNLIGVDVGGTLARGNLLAGISVNNSLNDTIGGTTGRAQNVIAGNGGHGIETSGATNGLLIEGNAIGTDATATRSLGNQGDGIHLFSSHNTIGGLSPNASNVIAYNGNSASGNVSGIGMALNVSSNVIYANSIFSNVGQGINLGGSGNLDQPPPTLSAASTDGTNSVISGSLGGSASNATYLLQFYSNTVADPSGFGEGTKFLGTAQVITDSSGNATFNSTIPVVLTPGAFITATATDPDGNTSQFARNITAQGNADLGVLLESNPTTANAGDTVTYTLTVTNHGTTAARGVTAIDQLPAGVTLVSVTTTATMTTGPNSVTFDFGTLDVNKTGVATIVVQTSSGSTPSITDSATVSSLEGDPNAGNNATSITTPVSPVTDLSVSVQGAPGSVPVGQNVTYTVTLRNNGPSQATNVNLVDTLPQNVTLVSANSTQGTTALNGNVLTTTIPTLDPNGTPVVLTIVVSTNAATSASITDSASVTANEADTNPVDNTGSATTTVTPVVDMGVTVQAAPNSVQVGQNVTYTVTVTNHGPSPATGIIVTDVLPANVTFVSALDSAGGSPTQAGGTVTDAIASLIANGVVTLTIVVSTNAATAAQITDSASVSASQPDPNTTNDNATVTSNVTPVTDLAVTMVASPGGVGAGQTVTYDITVKNNGPSQATGVTLTDLLPVGVTVVSATPSQGTTSQSPGTLVANLGTLGSNFSATLSIVVMTTAANPPSITNSAAVTGNEIDPTTVNNTVSTTTSVTPVTDLSVSVTPSTDPVMVNHDLTYTVTVTNNGPSAATGVVLSDVLPSGFTFVSAVDSLGNTPTVSGGSVVDTIGPLASGAAVTLTIVVSVTQPGQALNTASVTGNETDSTPGNNTSLVTSTVVPAADLSVVLTADHSQVRTGNLLTYTATITNNGPSTATAVNLTETLPGGVTILTITPSQGTTTQAGAVVTGSLGDLPAGATATITIVVIPNAAGPSTVVASVGATEVDTNSADNSSSVDVLIVEPPGTLQFAAPAVTVNETAGKATIFVTRTDGNQGAVSVKYFTRLTGSALPGVDFTAVSGTLTFNQGETAKSFVIPIHADPNDNRDQTINLILGAAQGGAILGSQTSTTVIVHDIDPDLVPPRVTDTRLSGTATSIIDIALYFSEGLNPATATSRTGFQLIDVGADGRFGTGDDRPVALRTPTYNPTTHVVTLQPLSPLKPNEFYYVRAMGVTDRAGNPLSAGAGSLGGNGFGTYVARGTNLQYADSRGSVVSLKLSGGGLLDLTRFANGDGQRLQVLNPVAGRTTIVGKVRGGTGATTLDSVTGLGRFGQVRLNMTTPPFQVTHMPFDRTIISPPAVDVVFNSGGVTVMAKALKGRRRP